MSNQHPDGRQDALTELETQLERFGFFSHTSLSAHTDRINEIESFLYGMIDTLTAQGLIDKKTLEAAVQKVRAEIIQKKENLQTGIAIRVDGPENDFIPVNCEERMPICEAVCCKLTFTLSVDEIESGKIKWDLGQPYFIRQSASGYCSHLNPANKCCSVYADRPKVCSKYSCANDKRIWKDFEKMILNREWIDENLKERKVRLQLLYMDPGEKIENKSL